MCSRWHWVRACSLSLFFVRILRFSPATQSKILGFFLCLSDKKLEMRFASVSARVYQIFYMTALIEKKHVSI